jgi:serine/threonine-protein kinase
MAVGRDLSGELLNGKLRVIRKLGAGGMGAVYEVEHTLTKHRRALKVLHGDIASDFHVVERFLREAAVAGTLGSPCVVDTYDAGQLEDGSPYVLMELLNGESLGSLLSRHRRLSVGDVAAIGVEMCRGLTALHAAGIVHRDIKPENVFLARDRDGVRVKLLDFGISKFGDTLSSGTKSGAIVGTPYYISPEQMQDSKRVDARTDLYSTGVTLYELVSGARPFEADTFPMLVIKVIRGECTPLGERVPVDSAFSAIVARAMALDPAARFASAAELGEALAPLASKDLGRLFDAASAAPVVPRVELGLISTLASTPALAPSTVPSEASVRVPGLRARSPVFWVGIVLLLAGVLAAIAVGLSLSSTPPIEGEAPVATTPAPPREPEPGMLAAPAMDASPPVVVVPAGADEPREEPPRMVRPSKRDGLETELWM